VSFAVALATTAGCGRSAQGGGKDAEAGSIAGSIRVGVSSAALLSNVTSVVLTVRPGGGPGFTPFTLPLSQSQDSWTAFITSVPPGPQRLFEIAAYDAAQVLVQSGSASVDVVSGETALVIINLQSTIPPDPFQNYAPVIDFMTASAPSAPPGGTVRLGMSAHDPDPLDTVAVSWAATCGTLAGASTSVAIWTAPATLGRCQISATARDGRGASTTLFLALDVVPPNAGALVIVRGGPNASPVITSVVSNAYYQSPVVGDLRASAIDPDGDPLSYAWASSCTSLVFATPNASSTAFTNPDGSLACVVTATVTDTNGGLVTGAVTLPPRIGTNLPPVITAANQPNVDATDPRKATPILPGDSVVLSVQAYDPEGQLLTFEWAAYGGTLDGQLDVQTSPGRSVVVFHAGAVVPPDAYVTVTVLDRGWESTTHVFPFRPGVSSCVGQLDGASCTDGNPCTLNDRCQGQVCVGLDPYVCPTAPQCKQAGVCQPSGPSAGTCTYADAVTGTPCDDGVACTGIDACASGLCVAGPSTCPSGSACDAGSGVCVCAPSCTGRACGDNGCGGSCGTCTGGATCNDATGQCQGGARVPTPAVTKQIPANVLNGLTFDAAGNAFACGQIACTYDANLSRCATAVFEGTVSAIPSGANDGWIASYDAASPYATRWVSLLSGKGESSSASDQSVTGVAVTASRVVAAIGFTNGGLTSSNSAINLPSAGSQSFLATLGASGAGLWGAQFSMGNRQLNGIASYQNRVAVCGQADAATPFATTGFTFTGAPNSDAVLAVFDVNPVTGVASLAWSRQLGAGADESCAAVAFDDLGDLVAVGQYNWVSGASLLDPGLGPLPDPNGTATPPSSSRKDLWVAAYDPAGRILRQAAFGNFGGNGAVTPKAVAIDASGNIAVAGAFTGAMPASPLATLTSVGSSDAFVLYLSPSLAPVWSARLGAPGTAADLASTAAFTSTGEVLAGGSFFGPASGAAVLPFTAGNGSEAFLLDFSQTGTVPYAQAFGGPGTQRVTQVAVNRLGSGSARDAFAFGGSYAGGTIVFPPLSPLPVAVAASFITWAPLGP
jgi:hypothetical protein